MATILESGILQSRFIGSPVTVPVTAATVDGAVFHMVRLQVKIGDANDVIKTGDVTMEFSSPAASGETVTMDISPALLAYADAWNPQPETFRYPSLTARLTACDDYMLDGESYRGKSPSAAVTLTNKYVGALTDLERGAGTAGTWSEPARYSRKPLTVPEPAFTGSQWLRACETGLNAPQSMPVTVAAGISADGRYYGIAAPADGYELRFINSLGVHENVFVTSLRETEVSAPSERHVIARRETLTAFSRAVMRKRPTHERWQMTSGPLDRAWVQWWLHELLPVERAWLRAGGRWLPVSIVTEETVTGPSRVQRDMLEVKFTVEFDINGSPV